MNSYYDNVEDKITIQNILSIIPKGKNNAIISDKIAHRLNVSDEKTQIFIRKSIRNAIESGYLIGSCKNGYFIIETAEEFSDYIDNLYSRKTGIQRRINCLCENWNSNGQIKLRLL